jgi:signal transduction histidine kinase
MNVLLNAIQAMPDGGTLAIRAFQETAGSPRHGETGTRGHGEVAPIRRVAASPRQVIIEVEDSGPGIAPADLDRVFEPYFTTKAGGTGLGLALAHKIFQEHGGSIRAKSDGGAGATFIITLPLLQDGP